MKYMGSKNRIADDIIETILNEYVKRLKSSRSDLIVYSRDSDTFVDVFCGGCSVIEKVPNTYKRIANDKQKYLIAMWRRLTKGYSIGLPTTISRELYSDVRDSYNKGDDRYRDDVKGWVGFMASFNGRFFDGGYSGHNVVGKNGKARDYIKENITNTLNQIQNLSDVQWYDLDYEELTKHIPENSILYCDPPYKGTTQYSISKDFDYERFYNWCRKMSKKGHFVFVSEYEMPEDFKCIWSKQITNAMHQTNTKKPVEKLFTL